MRREICCITEDLEGAAWRACSGVDPKRIYVDHGLTGTNRDRPSLREALAACLRGDTRVVTLDRLARTVLTLATSSTNSPPAACVLTSMARCGIRQTRSAALFTTLSMIAEFEADLARARTPEGMAVARAKGWLRGKQPKPGPRREAHLVAVACAAMAW